MLDFFASCSDLCQLKYSPKKKYFLGSFNNDRGLNLDDKTKDYVHRNTVGPVHSIHEVIQLG